VLASAMTGLSSRLDSKFLTAYWLPAFVAALGGFGILTVVVGAEQMQNWIYDLDSVEQTLAVLLLVLLISMLAFVLRAISHSLIEIFAGDALPRVVADWSTRGQFKLKRRRADRDGIKLNAPITSISPQLAANGLAASFPLTMPKLSRLFSATSSPPRPSTLDSPTPWKGFSGGPASRPSSRSTFRTGSVGPRRR